MADQQISRKGYSLDPNGLMPLERETPGARQGFLGSMIGLLRRQGPNRMFSSRLCLGLPVRSSLSQQIDPYPHRGDAIRGDADRWTGETGGQRESYDQPTGKLRTGYSREPVWHQFGCRRALNPCGAMSWFCVGWAAYWTLSYQSESHSKNLQRKVFGLSTTCAR
jgi:hypothetical protein